jgi:hypothetical protein
VKALKGWPITVRGDITEIIPLEEFRKMADEHTAKVTRTPATARKALIQAGILTKSGKRLSKHYR